MSLTNHPIVDTAYLESWHAWRDELERERRDPYGFLAFSAIYLLDAEPRRVPAIPGVWWTGADGPHVELSPGESLIVDGQTVAGEHRFVELSENEYRRAAAFGKIVIELSRRGGVDVLRPIDPQHDLITRYVETPAYEPTTDWLVAGEFMPFDSPRTQSIETVVAGVIHAYPAVGELVFEVDGHDQRVLVFSNKFVMDPETGLAPGFTLLTDATSGVTTYAASRSLAVSLPLAGGPVVIDFNRTSNLECAYTPYSQCSIPPLQNRLTVAIEAGEKIPVIED
jgi:uncharacterized protein